MITAQLINSEATLNNFFEIGSVRYSPGENVTVAFRLFDEQRNHRYIPPIACTITVYWTDVSNVEQSKAASVIDADDRSMWSVAFTPAETTNFGTSNLRIEADINGDATVIYIDVMTNILARSILSGAC